MSKLCTLALYDPYSLHTNTTLEHLNSLTMMPDVRVVFMPMLKDVEPQVDLRFFDCIIVHYSVRVAFENYHDLLPHWLSEFRGVRVLYIQDEYDFTETSRRFIEDADIDLVFTCVPESSREAIYPGERFGNVRFVSVLTGYVSPAVQSKGKPAISLNQRPLLVAYRGRALPYYYGELGQDKIRIAGLVADYCEERNLPCDISTDSAKRIYGEKWNEFNGSARATLITESGCNCFDFDGSIRADVEKLLSRRPEIAFENAAECVPAITRINAAMNQISPRVFEAISERTALIGFEGTYSGIIEPDKHYIPLQKDGSNLDEVFAIVRDAEKLSAYTDAAYQDVIESGTWSYAKAMRDQGQHLHDIFAQKQSRDKFPDPGNNLMAVQKFRTLLPVPGVITSVPLGRPEPVVEGVYSNLILRISVSIIKKTGRRIPEGVKRFAAGLLPAAFAKALRQKLRDDS